MPESNELATLVAEIFRPGVIHAFVGAGGKSTAMRVVAGILSARGARVRMTTTTRVGMTEFGGFPVAIARNAEEIRGAFAGDELVRLVVAASVPDQDKYLGLDPGLLSASSLGRDVVLLVEGDGSRRRPLKVPTSREPVIPAEAGAVLALLGASGFDEPIDEKHCYNHEAALDVLGKKSGTFDAVSIAALAAHPAGSRKGVLPGMEFHLLVNQGDLERKRQTGIEALRILRETHGIRGSLVSLQRGVVYETTLH